MMFRNAERLCGYQCWISPALVLALDVAASTPTPVHNTVKPRYNVVGYNKTL